ncbi:biotin--[acetyl-CoA-carboxylase] ligase [Tundrisphaera lichenicola]|uniref:biotin--[acetyl-CoA-carboxylase] ligase n=1 Tax=Tundrisphaera lichenicola TaxID=2029860 RepID=UPI003EBD562A
MSRAWPFVRSVHRFEEVDSTSDQARRMLSEGSLELPALIWAGSQTRGRGQGSNRWWSDAGSLTATVILDPSSIGLTPDREPRVALATASATIDAIAERYPACRAGIRWPNDIEVGGRKLGGILPERVGSGESSRLLIGIGLNVTTRVDQAPVEIRAMAASLNDWGRTESPVDPIEAMLALILERLEPSLQDLVCGSSRLTESWERLDVLAGRRIRVQIGSEMVEGMASGIDPSGGLIVRREGTIEVLHAGRVLRDQNSEIA